MRKYPDKDRRFELRRFVDEVYRQLEVSELEKILAHLAYLMGLHIEAKDGLRIELKTLVGMCSLFDELSAESKDGLRKLATRLKVQKERVLFWMWRSWILQKELEAPNLDVRSEFEWDELPAEYVAKRQQMVESINELDDKLHDLLCLIDERPSEVSYVLRHVPASPLAVLKTSEELFLNAARELKQFREQVSEAYGFGKHHRPNIRFDTKAKRNIETFFRWSIGLKDQSYIEPFLGGKTESRAKTAADKVADRFQTELLKYSDKLEELESSEDMPTIFYARRL